MAATIAPPIATALPRPSGSTRAHNRRTKKNIPRDASDRCVRMVRLIVQIGVKNHANSKTGG